MRVSGAAVGSITSELYVGRVGCLPVHGKGCTSPSQAALWPLALMSKRGACPSRLDDCTSLQKNLQNAFVGRRKGIACLVDCYIWLRGITSAYECAYARRTPHAGRLTLVIVVGVRVPGGAGCAWLFVRHAPRATHPSITRGGVSRFAHKRVLVIAQAAGVCHHTIRSKWGWAGVSPDAMVRNVALRNASKGRLLGKPRPSKYISVCFLSFFSLCGCLQTRRLKALFLDWRSGL